MLHSIHLKYQILQNMHIYNTVTLAIDAYSRVECSLVVKAAWGPQALSDRPQGQCIYCKRGAMKGSAAWCPLDRVLP